MLLEMKIEVSALGGLKLLEVLKTWKSLLYRLLINSAPLKLSLVSTRDTILCCIILECKWSEIKVLCGLVPFNRELTLKPKGLDATVILRTAGAYVTAYEPYLDDWQYWE